MNIEAGKFYKVISKQCEGWFLAEDSENKAKEMAQRMTNDADAFAVPIVDDVEIKDCLLKIKTVATFH